MAVTRATDDPQLLMVGKGSPYAKAEDLIAASKSKALKYGATGIGSTDHISTYTFAKVAGIQQPTIVHSVVTAISRSIWCPGTSMPPSATTPWPKAR